MHFARRGARDHLIETNRTQDYAFYTFVAFPFNPCFVFFYNVLLDSATRKTSETHDGVRRGIVREREYGGPIGSIRSGGAE